MAYHSFRRQSGFSSPPVTPSDVSASKILRSFSEGSENWIQQWGSVKATDLIDEPPHEIDEEATVEAACEMLLHENTSCLIVKSSSKPSKRRAGCVGLFDFADVNAFLTLAATQHTLTPGELDASPRMKDVVDAAKAGRVPIRLVSNLSDKNPLITLPSTSTLLDLLQIFSRGTKRVVIHSKSTVAPSSPSASGVTVSGLISDRQALSWFLKNAPLYQKPSLEPFLSAPLISLGIITYDPVTRNCDAMVLDAMRTMSTEGLSSLPVVDTASGKLMSIVSVNDIGRLVVPSQSKAMLTWPLAELVKQIKTPLGLTDGVDKYPVFSIGSQSTLLYTMQVLLATNAHRVCVVDDMDGTPVMSRFGVTSVVDVLSCFAALAGIDTDTRSMQRHRRASSCSSTSRRSQSGSSRPSSLLSSVSSFTSLPDQFAKQ